MGLLAGAGATHGRVNSPADEEVVLSQSLKVDIVFVCFGR
jgi:hypothetical protein